MVPAVGLSQVIVDYRDCTGQAPVPRDSGARDWCSAAGRVWLVGHNPGVFTPFLLTHTGDLVRYWDNNGSATTYRIASIQKVLRSAGATYVGDSDPGLVVQTCAVLDGSLDWVYRTIPV
jgi:hypothetical protein